MNVKLDGKEGEMMSVRWMMILCWLGLWAACVQAQPVAHYTFNDGTTKDITGNGYDGVLLGSAGVVVDGERGQVLQVNESGMQVDGPFGVTTAFTISAWVKLDVPRTGRYYFGGPWWIRTDNQGGSEHHWCEIRYPEGAFVDKFDTRSANSPDGQLDGQWHHIAVILPDSGEVKAYVDGALAPVRDNNSKAHDFGGSLGPLFFGTQNDAGGNAISGYMDNIRIYDYAVAEEDVSSLMEEGRGPEFAANPSPASGAVDVLRDVLLSWQAGSEAASHDVYLGTRFADVNSAEAGSPLLVGSEIGETTLDAGRLAFGQTYHWRVDEVGGPPNFETFRGEVWEFTTESFSNPIVPVSVTASSANNEEMPPENTINGSGLNASDQHSTQANDMWLTSQEDGERWIQYEFARAEKFHEMWVWNSNQGIESFIGFGAKTVTIEASLDGSVWAALENVPEFSQAPGRPDYQHNTVIDLGGVAARYLRLTVDAGWGMFSQVGLSEVRFFSIPVYAADPQPASGTAGLEPGVTLAWRAGRLAAEHEVLLGSQKDTLTSAATVGDSQMDTAGQDLQLGGTYYWQVNEVNTAETPSAWASDIWSFSMATFVTVDDMESYVDREGKWIWEAWSDGFEDPTNGATVGHGDLPETGIVFAGGKSMPFFFDNRGPALSEATRTFAPARDWSLAGITTLVLQFYADPANSDGQFYVKINGTKVTYLAPADAATPPGYAGWTQWNIDLAALGIDLANVGSMTLGVEGLNANGVLYIDDILLYKDAPPEPKVVQWFEAESGSVTVPMLVYQGDPLASTGMYIGTDEALGDATANPPIEGVASYQVQVPEGVYRLAFRMITYGGSNTLWVRIRDAVTNTVNHASGWALFDTELNDQWHWEIVNSRSDEGALVEFTLPAGSHTLDIAYREDGLLIDAIALISLTE